MKVKTKKELHRIFKYLVGGNIYFFTGYAVFAVCYSGFNLVWLPSKMIADVIGWTTNYIVQRFWTFSDRIHLSEMQHAGRYLVLEAVGLVTDYFIIWGLKSIGVTPYIGFFLSAWFFTVWRYLWFKYWVFPESGGKMVKAEKS